MLSKREIVELPLDFNNANSPAQLRRLADYMETLVAQGFRLESVPIYKTDSESFRFVKSVDARKIREREDLLSRPISTFAFGTHTKRVLNALDREGIKTIRDLVSLTTVKLGRIRNLGRMSQRAIIEKLDELGFKLGEL